MKTVQVEFFDINNCKNTITIDEWQTEMLFNEGIKIDASDVLGIFYVCDSDFVLKPEKKEKSSPILCKVYDEFGNELEKIKENKKEEFNTQTKQIKQFFTDFSFNSIHSVKPHAI